MKTPESTFALYFRSLWRRFWSDVGSDLKSGIVSLIVALAIVFFQYRMGLLPWTDTWRTALTRIIPYTILIAAYVQLRVSNENRVSSIVETCELLVDRGYDSPTRADRGGNPAPTNALDLGGPIEYGIPRSGWLRFTLRHSSVRGLVGQTAIVRLTDGTQRVTEARFTLR
jgi:hypothetical protein